MHKRIKRVTPLALIAALTPIERATPDNPLIHCLYLDFSVDELARLKSGLDCIPGDTEGRAKIWAKFKCNEATVMIRRNGGPGISSFVFFEVYDDAFGEKTLNILGGYAFGKSEGMTVPTFAQFEKFARMLDCERVRCQVARPGIVRLVQKTLQGWTLSPRMIGNEFLLSK